MLEWPRKKNDLTHVRHFVQFVFVFVSLSVGLQFHNFLQVVSTGARFDMSLRPAAVDAYLPISSLMSLIFLFRTGHANTVHPAGLVIFTLSLLLSLVLRRGFCSWVCPFGTAEEWMYKARRHIFKRTFRMPAWIDYALRSIKYLLLGFFVWAMLRMSAGELAEFIHGPYNRIADAKMYVFFQNITVAGAAVFAVIGILSLFFANFWCRYLCPYGALLCIFSLFSPTAVRRQSDQCTNCGKCSAACLNRLDPAAKQSVRSVECTACFNCISACTRQNALEFASPRRSFRLSCAAYGLIVVLAIYSTARLAESVHYWQTDTPAEMYKAIYEQVHRLEHP